MPTYDVTVELTIVVRVEVNGPEDADHEHCAAEKAMEVLDALGTDTITMQEMTCVDTEVVPPAA